MWITGCTLFAGGHAHCTHDWTIGATPLNQCWKLYHVLRGAGAVTFDSTQQNLTPGHLYIINGYRQTRQVCERTMEVNWLHFQVSSWRLRLRLDGLPPAVSLPCALRSWRAVSLKEVQELFGQPARAYRDLRGLRPDARPETHLRVLGVLLGVLGEALEKHPEPVGTVPDVPPQLQGALDFMDQNYLDNPPLATLARQAGWQAEYFHCRFRQALGMTPFAFMERRRMEEAVQLLTETDIPLKELSAQLRFSSQFYFTRVFTRRFGVSPSVFRRQAIRKG
jgi:AraC-like DNA-binding protein